jgi:hypothetical protein
MKRLVFYLIFGAALGTLLSTWLGPKAIGWYFNPPVNIGINCHEAIRWAMNKLVLTQMIGVAAGAALGVIIFFGFGRKKTETKILP